MEDEVYLRTGSKGSSPRAPSRKHHKVPGLPQSLSQAHVWVQAHLVFAKAEFELNVDDAETCREQTTGPEPASPAKTTSTPPLLRSGTTVRKLHPSKQIVTK